MTTPLAEYRRRVAAGQVVADASQEQAMQRLERLHRDLVAGGPPPRGWRRRVARLARRPIAPARGVYLWGGVGRGKTFMMDLFFAALPFDDKLRLHFHRFMAIVHDDLKRFRQNENPLELVAERFAERTRVLCFDELAVNDIADAMILGGLFAALFERGVSLATTSNLEPGELYRNGLQRQRFVPTIGLIREHSEVVHVGGDLDYRLQFLETADVYACPSDDEAWRRLDGYFHRIAPEGVDQDGRIEVLNRPIEYLRCSDGVIWFDFPQVCDGPRSQDDYIELSKLYHTVLLSNVPQFDRTLENQARRFIALVDEFYDRRVKLILSADAPVADIYQGEKLTHEFERTRSRLMEMQS
ncbi:MAG: AFG1 family ATPase, partial [Gammaproteobacteria bacterium]|nr:AFG1 family ATPase [Gammaproteobacteria bacterium]